MGRFKLERERGSVSTALCVPSMGVVQKGFKSPVYRMNTEEQKKLLAVERTTRGQLREGDRAWEGRLWENSQPMDKNSIGGRRGGKSWHNTAKSRHSVPEVNGAVGLRRTTQLPGEISTARGRASGSAVRSNALGDGREVSRGHTSDQRAGGCEMPVLNYETRRLDGVKDRTGKVARPGHLPTALNPTGGALNGTRSRAEKERPRAAAVPRGEAASVRYPLWGR